MKEARECGGESGNGYRTETGTERDGASCAYSHYACGIPLSSHVDRWKGTEGRVTSRQTDRQAGRQAARGWRGIGDAREQEGERLTSRVVLG